MINIDRIWKICLEKDFKLHLSNLAMHSVIQACVLFCTSSFFIHCTFIQIRVFGFAVKPYHFVESEIFWWICLPNISFYTCITSSCKINSDTWKKKYIHFKFECNILHKIAIFQLYLTKGVLCSMCYNSLGFQSEFMYLYCDVTFQV